MDRNQDVKEREREKLLTFHNLLQSLHLLLRICLVQSVKTKTEWNQITRGKEMKTITFLSSLIQLGIKIKLFVIPFMII